MANVYIPHAPKKKEEKVAFFNDWLFIWSHRYQYYFCIIAMSPFIIAQVCERIGKLK